MKRLEIFEWIESSMRQTVQQVQRVVKPHTLRRGGDLMMAAAQHEFYVRRLRIHGSRMRLPSP